MPQTNPNSPVADAGKGRTNPLMRYFSGRLDPLTSAILVFPLFLTYQLGILASHGQNGVDFVTRALIELSEQDLGNYLAVLGGLCLVYVATLVLLRRHGHFSPDAFLPMLAESTFYALTMGSLILFVMSNFLDVVPGLAIFSNRDPLDILVISAGAGLHEELIFRVLGVGGLAWLLAGLTGRKRAWLIALGLSSIVFSLAHHIGPTGEAFSFAAFTYRALAGLVFAIIYQVRGFAVAAWTHALYDIYVLSFSGE